MVRLVELYIASNILPYGFDRRMTSFGTVWSVPQRLANCLIVPVGVSRLLEQISRLLEQYGMFQT